MPQTNDPFTLTLRSDNTAHNTHYIKIKCPAGQCPKLNGDVITHDKYVINDSKWDLVFYFEPGQSLVEEVAIDTGVEYGYLTDNLAIYCYINEYPAVGDRPRDPTLTISGGNGGGGSKRIGKIDKLKPVTKLCSKKVITKFVYPCSCKDGV